MFYWRDVNQEVDFVLAKGGKVIAIEVKSTRRRASLPGIEAFTRQFKVYKKLLVGGQGIPLEEFLTTDVECVVLTVPMRTGWSGWFPDIGANCSGPSRYTHRPAHSEAAQ